MWEDALYLRSVELRAIPEGEESYVFSLPMVRRLGRLEFQKQVTFLVGENGAGKSTLMNLLYGLQAPTLGEIYIKGKPTGPQHGPENAMRMGVSMVHQHFKLVPSFTVAQNVMLGHEPRRGLFYDGHEAEETVRRLSAEYGLKVEPGDVVRDLSVGIQQRVEILKALRTGADVLILDEPTAGLDPAGRNSILQMIRDLHAAGGLTVIMVSHSMDDISTLATRLVVMSRGELVMTGTPREVFARADELVAAGLDVPQVTRVAMALRAKGLPIDPAVYTVAELKAALLALRKGGAVC